MPAPTRIGSTLGGKYRVDRLLGEGGMGVVYEATRVEIGDRVAVKLMLHDAARSPERLARFKREAQAAARAESEHVVRILDSGSLASGEPFIVMDLLEGEDLAQMLTNARELDVGVVLDLVAQACDAMAAAHRAGIVHRDLKPANLFVATRPGGAPVLKVLDFGLSKLADGVEAMPMTHTSTILGSPFYMSPEQLRSSRDVDARADIWSLGVIAFELLAGRPPFDHASVAELCTAILMRPPPSLRTLRPDVPETVAAIVARCLEKQADRRFASADDLAAALRACTPTGKIDVPQVLRASAMRSGGPAREARAGEQTVLEDEAPPTRVRLVAAPALEPESDPDDQPTRWRQPGALLHAPPLKPDWGAGATQVDTTAWPAIPADPLPFRRSDSGSTSGTRHRVEPAPRRWWMVGLLALGLLAIALAIGAHYWRLGA